MRFSLTFIALFILSACSHSYPPAPRVLEKSALNYHLQPGDAIKVTVYDEPDLTGVFRVNSHGDLNMPLVGPLPVANLSEQATADVIAMRLADGYMKEPNVTVALDQPRHVFVLGEVQKPGDYPFIPGMTVIQAVAVAGGYTYRADNDDIMLRRQKPGSARREVKLSGNEDTPLLASDTVTVGERYF